MIYSIAGATATGTTGTGSSSAVKTTTNPNDQMGKDAFLKLLVAQLKYQNPLSPMDGTQFIAQTAQLTMTEKLEELATLQTTASAENNKRSAAELVGRTITYDNGSSVVEGTVTAALMNAGAPVLLIGKTEVPLGKVLEVRATATPTQSTAAASTSTSTTGAETSTTGAAASTPSTTSTSTSTTSTGSTTSTPSTSTVTAPSTTTTTTSTSTPTTATP
jgi:flagellar basal-body rod modification protein FlgD